MEIMNSPLSYTKPNFSFCPTLQFEFSRRPITLSFPIRRRSSIVAITTSSCDLSGLNAPLEPRTRAGKFLSGVLLDDRESFQSVARKVLEQLATDRSEATARLQNSLGSEEACLHRRIAELTSQECQKAVEDVIYNLLLYKFSEMGVHLIPKLSKCVYNGRFEILPSKNWELESIHSSEVLELVRHHINVVIGLRSNANITDCWATTKLKRLALRKLYTASILYGYFLKSASLRHRLEWGPKYRNTPLGVVSKIVSFGSNHVSLNHVRNLRSMAVGQVSYVPGVKMETLRGYVMGFDPEMIHTCAKPKSKEAVDLIERHNCALFGDKKTSLLETSELICTSFASLKRFVLEGVAFGSFLWETENCVNTVYMLEEN